MCILSFISESYLVRTVFLVDHRSQHPRAELAELREQKRDWDTIPSPAEVFPVRGGEKRGGILPSVWSRLKINSCFPLLACQSYPVLFLSLFSACFSVCLFVERAGKGLIAASPKLTEGGERQIGGGVWERERETEREGSSEKRSTFPAAFLCLDRTEMGEELMGWVYAELLASGKRGQWKSQEGRVGIWAWCGSGSGSYGVIKRKEPVNP